MFFTGEYAKEVVVLMDQSVRVSQDMTILIAVKKEGNEFKAKVHLNSEDIDIVITKPTVTDSSSKILKEICKFNTRIKHEDCDSYFKGNIDFT